jgi:hypothetical protein
MVELPGWIKTVPAGVTIAADDLSSALLRRFGTLTDQRAAPGMRPEDQHWAIQWPHPDLSARVFAEGIAAESAGDLNYRPALERLLSKHSPSGVAVWGIGAEKHGIFLGPYADELRSWVKADLIFSPTVMLARDADIVLIADEQMRFSVVGAPLGVMVELDASLGGRNAIDEAIGAYIEHLGIGFGEEDRAWAVKYLKSQSH